MSATVSDASPVAPAQGDGPARPAVSIGHLNKTFRLPRERSHTLKERALHPFRRSEVDALNAVDDVSFEIPEGEFFGIVGRNGSGKSTLLKCLAGIYRVDSGSIEVNGRISPFIELGVGFNPELTARDNVIINAIMLGLTRRQAEAAFDEIVAFAELERFMELKLKNYSIGMHVRLAFSVAIQVEADILLIDEVLAVGDAAFQQKCFQEFGRLKAAGRTIVFVTHDMGAVRRFCDRAMLLERGHLVHIGDPVEVARRYNELNFRRVREEARSYGGPETLRREPVAELLNAWFEDADGRSLVGATQGEECCVRMDVRFHDHVEDPLFAISLANDEGAICFATNNYLRHGPAGKYRPGERALVTVRFANWLAPGRYRLTASISPHGVAADAYDLREDISSFLVRAELSGGGAADLPHRFEIERG